MSYGRVSRYVHIVLYTSGVRTCKDCTPRCRNYKQGCVFEKKYTSESSVYCELSCRRKTNTFLIVVAVVTTLSHSRWTISCRWQVDGGGNRWALIHPSVMLMLTELALLLQPLISSVLHSAKQQPADFSVCLPVQGSQVSPALNCVIHLEKCCSVFNWLCQNSTQINIYISFYSTFS